MSVIAGTNLSEAMQHLGQVSVSLLEMSRAECKTLYYNFIIGSYGLVGCINPLLHGYNRHLPFVLTTKDKQPVFSSYRHAVA